MNKVKSFRTAKDISQLTLARSVEVSRQTINMIENDKYKTVENINNYVEDNINYKFYWFPRGIYQTWNTKEGDCTDIAMLKCYFLEKLNYQCRLVHGIADGELHDWYEVRLDNKWQTTETKYYYKLKKIGYGVW